GPPLGFARFIPFSPDFCSFAVGNHGAANASDTEPVSGLRAFRFGAELGLTGLAQGIPIFVLGLFAGTLIFGGAISATLTLGCRKMMPGLRTFGTEIRRR